MNLLFRRKIIVNKTNVVGIDSIYSCYSNLLALKLISNRLRI